MSNPTLPPNNTQPQPPQPPQMRFTADCTDHLGRSISLDIEAPNSLGAVARVLAFLCDNLIDVKRVVITRKLGPVIVPMEKPALFRG